MADSVRTYVVVGFDVAERRWCPMFRCETLERAQAVFAPINAVLAAFCELVSIDCDIEDVDAIEAMCAELRPVSLYEVFTAYAEVADEAFRQGGGKWYRLLPEGAKRAKRKKGGNVH